MLFNSIDFALFFPIVVLVYYILPLKVRYVWLFVSSYYFYMQWNPYYILLLLFCTLVTYAGGLLLEKWKDTEGKTRCRKQYVCLGICLFLLLSVLVVFKYADFIVVHINRVLFLLRFNEITWNYSILLPVGISFYTLQAIGYLLDVWRGEIYAEKNFLRYGLFLSFFPQLVAGPIERSKNLLVQLGSPKKFSYEYFRQGILIMLWGFFLKMVIADRASILVNTVYGDSEKYSGLYIVIATLFFSIQIYCDFYGYSTIARGAAMIFGIRLMENFNAPYLSRSVKEFWRRWHISLSGWFRDYLYIPLGGNRKGVIGRHRNLLVVFGISGLWHGAAVSFVFWGVLNAMYQIIGEYWKEVKKIAEKAGKVTEETFSGRLLQRLFTFIIISFSWLFFRAGNMPTAIDTLQNMLCIDWKILFDGSLFCLGISQEYMGILLTAIGMLFYMDYKKYKGCDMVQAFFRQEWWLWAILTVILVIVILLFGCYGVKYDTKEFIYFQF